MNHEPVVIIVDELEIYNEIRLPLSRALNSSHIMHCPDRESAMEMVRSDLKADLIFAAWEMTGPSFIDEVRKDLENHHTPIVMMTDSDLPQVVSSALQHGANAYLAKPFMEKALLKKVAEVLRMVERRRKKRIHPEKLYPIEITFDNDKTASLQLVDFSLDCCLVRASSQLCSEICIYQECMVRMRVEEFDVSLDADLFRVEHDVPLPPQRDTVLMMFRFTDNHTDRLEKLNDMLDELRARW
jgi:CheY-like chemotaxis protein